MFRLANNLRNLKLSTEAFTNTQQTLRWRRKPRWIPTAKSKIFRVPQRPVIPKEENDELQRLHNNYRTQIKSLRRYLTYKYATRLHAVDNSEQLHQEFEEDFVRCTELNNRWNEDIKKERESRYTAVLENELNIARERLDTRKKINQAKLEEAEELVRQQKEVAHTFITLKNIDEAIEKAIGNAVDYNYSIDADGNKIHGRETAPEDENEKQTVKQ